MSEALVDLTGVVGSEPADRMRPSNLSFLSFSKLSVAVVVDDGGIVWGLVIGVKGDACV